MARSTFGVRPMLLGMLAALALMLVGGQPAAAAPGTSSTVAPSAATWELRDIGQRTCLQHNTSNFTYFMVLVQGSWSTPLELGVGNLPAGTTTTLPHELVPPGSSEGSVPVSLIGFYLPPLPIGIYQPKLTVSDGTVTQSVQVTIKMQERWGC